MAAIFSVLRDLPRTSGIYCIINTNNNKKYIGSAINIYNRLRDHVDDLRHLKHGNKHLQSSFNKNGEKSFIIKVLAVCNKEFLIESEQNFINYIKPEYNIRKIAQSNLGLKYSNESKLKMSEKGKGRIVSKETRMKISILHKGSKRRKETCENISKALIGRRLSKEHRLKLSLIKKGKISNNDNRRKILQYTKSNFLVREYISIVEAGNSSLVSRTAISNCLSGLTKTSGNYIWKYKEVLNG